MNDSKLVWGIKRAFKSSSAWELFHMFNVKFSLFEQLETCFTSLILREAMSAAPILSHVVYCWYWHGACLRTCLRNRVPWGKENPVPGCWNWGPSTVRTGQAAEHVGQQSNQVKVRLWALSSRRDFESNFGFSSHVMCCSHSELSSSLGFGIFSTSISSAVASHADMYSHIICTLVVVSKYS